MSIPQRQKTDFEQLATGDFITGVIEEVQEDMQHKFKGFQGAEDTVQPAVRFIFKFDNYQHKHYSRWMKFSYHEKSNLYTKYVAQLVEGAEPEFSFDIQDLKGLPIKAIWKDEKNGFQSIELIKPLKNKLLFNPEAAIPKAVTSDEEIICTPPATDEEPDIPF